ncbi:fasciclin domain-containing protein [Nocardioides sp. 1609]|uniref:fasciclin domain-containing protein n=1 Tax=Nocardioides sp. 1609 TaxID=2508327 RepID=UPI00106F9050|nr:fasciclin domain-containing protein [Nocardioides sp. 1609]
MKLKTLRRGTAAAAVLTLSISLAACGSEDDSSDDNAGDTSSAPAETESEAPPAEDTPSEDSGAEAGGEFDAVFGPACSSLPAEGEPGSLTGMVVDPVATAAGTNPLLETLVTAVGAVDGLAGTLNDAPALTVFAPANDAFAAIDPATLQGLLDGAKADGAQSDLATILSHHVLGENLDPTAVVGEQPTLIGDNLTISGDPEAGMTVSDGKVEAKVLCGGIPTANATVYVIDSVLTNAMPTS